MIAEQIEQKPQVFVSYSRVDSEFAYRLRADLEASGFHTWIDTTKLGDQGGQEWLRIIQDAVDASQAMVVAISPDSVQSKYVHMEYHRAQSQNKLVIPLHYRTVTSAPMDLDLTQWLEFRENQGGTDTYQVGLTNLIRSLGKAPHPPKPVSLPRAPHTPSAPLAIAEGIDMPEFRPISLASPEPSADIQDLIAGVYDAHGRDDLVSEEYFLRQVVHQMDARVSAQYAARLAEVVSRIEKQRIARLRDLATDAVAAKQWRRALGAWQALLSASPDAQDAKSGIWQARVARAHEALRDGEYDEAVGTWQALVRLDATSHEAREGLREALRARAMSAWSKAEWTRAAESWETLRALDPPEPDAQVYLDAIEQNRREAYHYQMALRLMAAGNTAGAKAALEDLYRAAPSHGDPAGIAEQLGVIIGFYSDEAPPANEDALLLSQPPKRRTTVAGSVLGAIGAAFMRAMVGGLLGAAVGAALGGIVGAVDGAITSAHDVIYCGNHCLTLYNSAADGALVGAAVIGTIFAIISALNVPD